MKAVTRHIGKLEILERIRNTPNGNPRWRVRVDGHSCVTKSDASYSHKLTNYRDQTVEATIGTHYGVATLDTIRSHSS